MAQKSYQKIADLMKILSDKNRLKILSCLKEGEKCVCEIYVELKLSQNLTSHHLSIMKRSKILDSRKEGRSVYYFINQKTFQIIKNFINSI